jgi:hypothetical protein
MALKFRRGTTAQQSGSLAFGEPFVNTTLGTLLVGGPNGDIVLSAGGTGSTGNFGPISGSGLDITGNANIAGNLTLGGNITIGDNTSDTVNVTANLSSSLIPHTTKVFDLGSPTKEWKNLYVSNSNFSGNVSITGSLIASGSNVEFTRGWPAVGSESHFLRLAPFTSSNGRPYEGIGIVIEHWDDGTGTYEHSLQIHSFDNDSNPTYGAELNVSPFRTHIQALPSGSGGNVANISVQDLKNGKSQALVYGDYVQIGYYTGQEIKIGNSGSVTEMSGSIRVTSLTGSIAATNGVVSGSSQVTLQSTTGFTAYNTALATITGSLISSASAAKTTNDSQAVSITNLNSATASLLIETANLETFSSSALTRFTTLATYTGSVEDRFSTLATLTGSNSTRLTALEASASTALSTNNTQATSITNLNSTTASLSQRVAANEAVSGTFARTNSTNTFNGSQTVSGSLTVTQDLIVLGSSSIQTISSSNLVIGAALVTLNTATPSVRFAGLNIIDSGSSGGSGSFLYDAVQDELLFIHRGNGTNITSSVLLMGPETYDNLGNETYLTNNRLPKGTGKEHLVDSNITDNGTTITLASNTVITGTIVASGTTLVSGSSQITAGSTTNFATDVKTQLNSNTVVSGSSQVIGILSSLNTYTGSNDTTNTTQNTRLTALEASASTALSTNNTQATSITNLNSATASLLIETANLETFSASALTRLTALEVETANLESYTSSFAAASVVLTNKTISGASNTLSNIANASLTNSSITLNGTSVALGASATILNLVSGSSQVTLSSTTGYGTVINQNLLTTSNVQHASLGIGMAASGTAGRIDATNDVVAFSSSDIRFKENIKPIENAIDKIRKISGNTYDWKEENKVEHGYEGNDVGVIAQEIEAVLPQLVQTRESGFKAVKYDKLVALLIEGIKEQQLQIEQLRIDLNNCNSNKGL